jgi:histidinol-phosphate aminotransferase
MKIKDWVQKEVRSLSCYDIKTILGQKNQKKIMKMNLNENFALPNKSIQELLLDACRSIDVRAYPPPRGSLATKAISRFLGFSECEVSVANGADEILDLIMKVFVRKGSKVMIVEPSFPMYTFFTQLYGGNTVPISLQQDFSLDVDAILTKAEKDTRLLFVCSPNNPTGNQFREAKIKKLLQEFNGVVIVDEAYVDFASGSVLNWVKKYDNLAVLRSFSKAFGLAGLRLGYLVSSESIAGYVQRVMGPFNVNSVTQQAIVLALEKWSYFEQQFKYVIKERKMLMKNLTQINGVNPYPSEANFILFKIARDCLTSAIVSKRLEKRGVLVKDRGHIPLLENCIRVTVGTRNMNEAFLSALKESMEE